MDEEQKESSIVAIFFQIPIVLSISAGATTLVIFTLLNWLGMPRWSEGYQNFAWFGAILIISGVSWFAVGQVLKHKNE